MEKIVVLLLVMFFWRSWLYVGMVDSFTEEKKKNKKKPSVKISVHFYVRFMKSTLGYLSLFQSKILSSNDFWLFRKTFQFLKQYWEEIITKRDTLR